jgi:hypothetical protein
MSRPTFARFGASCAKSKGWCFDGLRVWVRNGSTKDDLDAVTRRARGAGRSLVFIASRAQRRNGDRSLTNVRRSGPLLKTRSKPLEMFDVV